MRQTWLLMMLLLLARPPIASAQDEPQLQLRYIPDSAVGAVVVFPQHLSQKPELELMPFEIIKATVEKELGIDPFNVEQAIAVVAAPAQGMPPQGGFILHFTTPQKYSQQILENTEEATVRGIRYQRGERASFCIVGQRTLLIAPDPFLQTMLNAENAESALISELSDVSLSSDVTALLVVEPLRPLIADALQNAPPLPPPFQPLLELPRQVDSVLVQANFAPGQPSSITLSSQDQATASKVRETVVNAIKTGKQLLLAQIAKQQPPSDDPVDKATAAYLQRVANTIESRLQPELKNNKVVLTLQSDFATTGVLVSLLLPAVQAAREAARRTQDANDLKQIAIALHNYHDVHRGFPPLANRDDDGNGLLSWRVHLLPYLGEQALYEQFKLDEPWDSEHNRALIERIPAAYQSAKVTEPGATVYLAPVLDNGVFDDEQSIKLAEITDGVSHTVMIVQVDADRAVPWTKPQDLDIDKNNPTDGLGNLFPGGFHVTFADASVRFVANTVDPEVFFGLLTRNQREEVSQFDLQ